MINGQNSHAVGARSGPRFDPRAYQIARPQPHEYPWPLLLEADPAEDRVRAYLDVELFRVAWRGERIEACYVLVAHAPTRYQLLNIAVVPDRRGTGLGRWMLGHAIGLAESKGARTIDVDVTHASEAARRFFQRNRFAPVDATVHNLRLTLTPE
jgi:GNAT superfamily N-acetyltransferase